MSLEVTTSDPHSAHLALAFGALAVLALAATAADLASRFRRIPAALRAAALLSAVGAAVHGAVVPHHLREAASLGLFFITAGGAQLAWAAIVLTHPRRALLVAGLVGNLGLLTLWAISRSIGLPFGPDAGVIEPVGLADLLASSTELALVVLVSSHLVRTNARPAQPAPPAAIRATPRRAAATPMS